MSIHLVVAEVVGGVPAAYARELISASRKADGDAEIAVALVGSGVPDTTDLPVDKAYILDDESLVDCNAGVFETPVDALASLCRRVEPDAVLFSKSDFGSIVGPRLAFRLGSCAAQDCTDVESDAESSRLIVTRPVHGGNAVARMRFAPGALQVIVVRAGAFEPATGRGTPRPERVDLTGQINPTRAKLKRTVAEAAEGVRLEDADVVVSGGRGLGGPEPFKQLEDLANMLGGAVGASRAACDAGWIDHSHQVGLTGKSIRPRLYITVGISGASQHMAGCSSARNIVAINSDSEANIFKEARFGVVGDWKEVLPAFIEAARDLGAGQR